MIAMAVLGLLLIFVVAGVVCIVDARRTQFWRDVAAERRARWESWMAGPDGGAS